jgi:hypothetical protein
MKKIQVVSLTAERNTEAKKKEERREHAQKESTLQAITKTEFKIRKGIARVEG